MRYLAFAVLALSLAACGNIDKQTGAAMPDALCKDAIDKAASVGSKVAVAKPGYVVHDYGGGPYGGGMFCYKKAS